MNSVTITTSTELIHINILLKEILCLSSSSR